MTSQSQVILALTLFLALAPTWTVSQLTYCGNKYCGIGAECNNNTKKCECHEPQPLGDPVFRCHSDDTVSCVLVGDPSLLGFSSSLTFLDFPCKVTLTKYDTPLLTRRHNSNPPGEWNVADPGRDRCRVIIHGTNAASPRGTYYLKTVDVTISFDIGGSKKLETLLVKLSGDKATYTYAPYPEVTVERDDRNQKQDCMPIIFDYINNIGITLCYNEDFQLWTLGVQNCGGTYVNFRAWEGLSENQELRPGLSILASGKSFLFNNEANDYPATVCGSPFTDYDDIYHDKNKQLGLEGKRNGALYSFLANNPPEQPHYCMTSIELFNICSADKRVEAVNQCGPIVTQLGKCAIKNGRDIMNVFELCLAAVCFDPASCSKVAENIHHGDEDDCNSFKDPC